MTLSTTELETLKRVAMGATPGNWYHAPTHDRQFVRSHEMGAEVATYYAVCETWGGNGANAKDAEYISRLNPQVALALINEVRELRKVGDALAEAYEGSIRSDCNRLGNQHLADDMIECSDALAAFRAARGE